MTVPHHFSPSSLALFDRCPSAYRRHYIDGVLDPITEPLAFGKAVHAGLEADLLTGGGDIAFLSVCHLLGAELAAVGLAWPADARSSGLALLERARLLGITGEPERHVSLALPNLPPIIGVVDVWDETSRTITDWKTSRFPWTQKRADAAVWQPALYTLAWQHEHPDEQIEPGPIFQFVVLPRGGGPIQTFNASRSVRQIGQAMQRFWQIVEDLEHDRFPCTCGQHRPLFDVPEPPEPADLVAWA